MFRKTDDYRTKILYTKTENTEINIGLRNLNWYINTFLFYETQSLAFRRIDWLPFFAPAIQLTTT